jgi:hypothetical protein
MGTNDPKRSQAEQLVAFYTWLPHELHALPIKWEELSHEIQGYCVHSIGSDPEKGAIALAMGAASTHVRKKTLLGYTCGGYMEYPPRNLMVYLFS